MISIRKGVLVFLVLPLILTIFPLPALATDEYVNNFAQLQSAITNASGQKNIIVTQNITFTSELVITAEKDITIKSTEGNNFTLIMSSGSNSRHFVVSTNASLVLENIVLDGGYNGFNYDYSGGIDNSGILTLNVDAIITKCYYHSGGGIYNDYSSTLIINGGEICDNNASRGGGIENNGTITINSGVISGNTGNSGGGIFNDFFGTVSISDSEISGNSAISQGGGIYSQTWPNSDIYGKITINGSVIRGNIAEIGGGIYNNDGIVNISDSNVSDNSASGIILAYGGGIYNNNGTVVISDCEISGNKAILEFDYGYMGDYGSGGGIHNDYSGTITISGGKISDNTATKHGGGIYCKSGSTVTVNDSVISSNTAEIGGGICTQYLADVTVSNTVLSGNIASYAYWLADAADIATHNTQITEVTSFSAPPAGKKPFEYAYNNYDIGYNKFAISLNQTGTYIFPFDTEGYLDQTALTVTVSNTGYIPTNYLNILLSGTSADTFTISKTSIENIAVGDDDIFTIVPKTNLLAGTYTATVTVLNSNAVQQSFDVSFTVNPSIVIERYIVTKDSDGSVIGKYHWLADAVAACGVYTADGAYTISATEDDAHVTGTVGTAVIIPPDKVITFMSDSNGPYTITQTNMARHLNVQGGLTLSNIIIEGNGFSNDNATNGGIEVSGELTINEGAVITKCCSVFGGGIYNDYYGSIIISGGEICDNAASWGGGIYNDYNGTVTISNGKISGNTANWGGGINNTYYGKVVINSSEISDNAASGGGSGMYNGGVATINGSEISCNTGALQGGGIHNHFWGTVTIGATEISGNTAESGGGIYNEATVVINGCEISGNTGGRIGGGICNDYGGNVTISGGKVSDNTASRGGGVYNSIGTLNINDGCEISGNTAEIGGGIYAQHITNIMASDTMFSGNIASYAYWLTDAADIATHKAQITGVTNFSNPPEGSKPFEYAYNNYDIGYYKYGISLSQTEKYIFPAVTESYPDQTALIVTVYNTGYIPINYLNITLSGTSTGAFIISKTLINNIAVGDNDTFTIVPKTSLLAGTYTATVTVFSSDVMEQSFDISFTVNPSIYYERYVVTKDSDGSVIGKYYWLADAVTACGVYEVNGTYTITVTEDDTHVTGGVNTAVIIPPNKVITLLSNSNGPYTITQLNMARHFNVQGGLTLSNIIIEGNGLSNDNATNGGIEVSGELTINDGTVITKCCSLFGGGIYNYNFGTVTIINSKISGNTAESGSGIYNDYFGTVTISSSVISNNGANWGGGIYNNYYGTVAISGSKISDNAATSGSGIYSNGAVTINDSVVSDNTVNGMGGGIYNNFGTIDISGGIITGNKAIGRSGQDGEFVGHGGGIYIRSGTVNISGGDISGNMATNQGGGIFTEYLNLVKISDALFSGNTATQAYWMTDTTDIATYHEQISGLLSLSNPPAGNKPFEFAYNNYDISYTKGLTENPITSKYIVKFVDWDDTVLDEQVVEHGKAAVAPANPRRTGFEFVGWCTESGNAWNFDDPVVDNVILYAQWKESKEGITVNFSGVKGVSVQYFTNVTGWITVGTFDNICEFLIPEDKKATFGETTIRAVKGGMSYTFSSLVMEGPLVFDVPVKTIEIIGIAADCNLAIVQDDWVYAYAPAAVGVPNYFKVFDNGKKYEVRLSKTGFYPVLAYGINADQTVFFGPSYLYQVTVPAGITNVRMQSNDWIVNGAGPGNKITLLCDAYGTIRDARMTYVFDGQTYTKDFKLDGSNPFEGLI